MKTPAISHHTPSKRLQVTSLIVLSLSYLYSDVRQASRKLIHEVNPQVEVAKKPKRFSEHLAQWRRQHPGQVISDGVWAGWYNNFMSKFY